MAMKSACCCASLRTGTLIVGWVTVVLIVLNVLVTTTLVVSPAEQDEDMGKAGGAEDEVPSGCVNSDWSEQTHKSKKQKRGEPGNGTQNYTFLTGGQEFDALYSLYNHPYIDYGTDILGILVSASLLYGTYKRRPVFFIPYQIVYGITTVLTVPLTIYWFAKGLHIVVLAPIIVDIPINIYCICVIWSYYDQLRSESDDPKKV